MPADADQHDEIRLLKAELRRVTEERDILEKAAAFFGGDYWNATDSQVVGGAMRNTQHTDVVLQALLPAAWRRKPEPGLLLHSGQGSQYTSTAWQTFLRAHGIVCRMSRRGSCHDNAVAESFFQLLKRERIRRHMYPAHAAARADVFDCIEMFYNPKRRHGSNGAVSPVKFEARHAQNGS